MFVVKKAITEYALNNLRNPIAIAEYRFPEVLLFDERLKSEMENVVRLIERGVEDTIESDRCYFVGNLK